MVRYNNIIKVIEGELYKTHDGTALPRHIRQQFKTFIRKWGNVEDEILETYSKTGKTLTHQQGNSTSCATGSDEVRETGEQGTHEIHTHPIGDVSGLPKLQIRLMNIPTRFSFADFMSSWDEKADDGENYLYQSLSCCDEFGHVMTITKNNHYTDRDFSKYFDMTDKFEKACSHYVTDTYYPKFNEACGRVLEEYKVQTGDLHPSNEVKLKLFQKVHDETIKEIGTFDDMLVNKGIYQGFEDCNCKLKLTRIKL